MQYVNTICCLVILSDSLLFNGPVIARCGPIISQFENSFNKL